MNLYTNDLLLKTVANEDIDEVARMWNFEKGSISLAEAQKAIDYMQSNHRKNKTGHIHHLCFAIYEKSGKSIIGWCGLDGQCSPGKTVIFYLIDKEYRNKGYATQCADKLLEYAFNIAEIDSVYGGCFKDNIASYKVQVKIGMVLYKTDKDSGDPLFYTDKDIYTKVKSLKQ